MPTYTMTGPDGKDYSIDGPAGATPAQVQAQLQARFGAQAPAPQTTRPPPASSVPRPSLMDYSESGPIESALNAATFGAAPGIEAAIGSAASHLLPGENVSYQQALDAINAQHARAVAQHPWLSALGSIAGAAVPAIATGGATIPESLALREGGSLLGNAARVVGAGAVGGAEYGAAEGAAKKLTGQTPDTSLLGGTTMGAAIGGVTGAATGAALGGAVGAGRYVGRELMGSVDNKAMAALANLVQLPVKKVAAAVADLGTRLGKPASLAQAADLLTQGRIAAASSKNPELSAAIQGAATTFDSSLPSLLGNTLGTPKEIVDLTNARANDMTAAMTPIRNTAIPLTPQQKAFLQQPIITRALNARNATATDKGIVDPSGNIIRPASLLSKIDKLGTPQEKPLTIDELDSLRETMGTEAESFGNPDNTAPDRRQRAEDYRAVRKGVESILTQPQPALDDPATAAAKAQYGAALGKYKLDSHFIRAYKAGRSGKYPQEITDDETKASLTTPQGIQGYEAGLVKHVADRTFGGTGSAINLANELSQNTKLAGNVQATLPQGQRLTAQAKAAMQAGGALHSSAPGAAPRPNEASVHDIGHLGAAALYHSVPGAVYRLSYLLPNGKYSPAVQRKVAQMLLDPKQVPTAVSWLSAQGVKDQAIRDLLNNTVPAAGAVAASGTQP